MNCASRSIGLLDRLPALDPRALHALGDEIAGTQAETLAAFMDAVNAWLSARLQERPAAGPRLARVAEVWAAVNRAAREAEAYNLDRKPLVFSVFGRLAEAAGHSERCRRLPRRRAVDTNGAACPISPAITSPPRSPIRTARRISGMPTR